MARNTGRKTKCLRSTQVKMTCNSCNYCGRVFSGKNKKLITKLVKIHTKKCMEATPQLSLKQRSANTTKMKTQLDSMSAGFATKDKFRYAGNV